MVFICLRQTLLVYLVTVRFRDVVNAVVQPAVENAKVDTFLRGAFVFNKTCIHPIVITLKNQ